jgi:hypothetical protein
MKSLSLSISLRNEIRQTKYNFIYYYFYINKVEVFYSEIKIGRGWYPNVPAVRKRVLLKIPTLEVDSFCTLKNLKMNIQFRILLGL